MKSNTSTRREIERRLRAEEKLQDRRRRRARKRDEAGEHQQGTPGALAPVCAALDGQQPASSSSGSVG